jgi:hypothetical protein
MLFRYIINDDDDGIFILFRYIVKEQKKNVASKIYIYISSFELKIVLKRKEKCRVICHCNIIYLFDNHMRLFYVGKKLINFGRTLGRNEIKNLVFIFVVDCKYLIETGVRLKCEHL